MHDLAAVQQYLAEGGDPNGADSDGEVLLNKAVLHGTPEILEALLAAGANPDRPGKNGLGPLAIAALAGRQAMLERLMQANAGPAATEAVAADAQPAPAAHAPAVEDEDTALPPAGPGSSSPTLAALARDEAPQALLPIEAYASMVGLAINPIARPQTSAPVAAAPLAAAPVAAAPVAGAPEAVQQPVPPATAPNPIAATAGSDVPQSWASAAQRRLGQLGYYKGPVTGFAGPLTADAVKRYQAVAGIPQDGIVSADLLRRIGATVDALTTPDPAPAPAAAATPAPAAATAAATPPAQGGAPGQATGQGLQQVRNALGEEFNSATRLDALRQHCQANTNAWVYDEATGRSMFCRDVLGSPPR
ncbi:MAG TPA: peptidoglycan-binding protein [Rhodospirillales bacterium]|nr:peptidoglycan-binding protein [Rhodospirillales bacterium]